MKRLTVLSAVMLVLSVAVNVFGMTLRPAAATVPSKPYTFVANTLAQSAQVNGDFDPLYSVLNGNLDHSNLASGTGIYATDIKPTSAAQATFGGTQTYTFTQGLLLSNLTASTCMGTDANKNLANTHCVDSIVQGSGITVTPSGNAYTIATAASYAPLNSAVSFSQITDTGLTPNAGAVCTNGSSVLTTSGCNAGAVIYDSGGTPHTMKTLYIQSFSMGNIVSCASLAVCTSKSYTPPAIFSVLPACHASPDNATQTPYMTLQLSSSYAAGPWTFEVQNQTSSTQGGIYTYDIVCVGY